MNKHFALPSGWSIGGTILAGILLTVGSMITQPLIETLLSLASNIPRPNT